MPPVPSAAPAHGVFFQGECAHRRADAGAEALSEELTELTAAQTLGILNEASKVRGVLQVMLKGCRPVVSQPPIEPATGQSAGAATTATSAAPSNPADESLIALLGLDRWGSPARSGGGLTPGSEFTPPAGRLPPSAGHSKRAREESPLDSRGGLYDPHGRRRGRVAALEAAMDAAAEGEDDPDYEDEESDKDEGAEDEGDADADADADGGAGSETDDHMERGDETSRVDDSAAANAPLAAAAPSPMRGLFNVTPPAHTQPGQTFEADVNGRVFTLRAPADWRSGQKLLLDVGALAPVAPLLGGDAFPVAAAHGDTGYRLELPNLGDGGGGGVLSSGPALLLARLRAPLARGDPDRCDSGAITQGATTEQPLCALVPLPPELRLREGGAVSFLLRARPIPPVAPAAVVQSGARVAFLAGGPLADAAEGDESFMQKRYAVTVPQFAADIPGRHGLVRVALPDDDRKRALVFVPLTIQAGDTLFCAPSWAQTSAVQAGSLGARPFETGGVSVGSAMSEGGVERLAAAAAAGTEPNSVAEMETTCATEFAIRIPAEACAGQEVVACTPAGTLVTFAVPEGCPASSEGCPASSEGRKVVVRVPRAALEAFGGVVASDVRVAVDSTG